LAFKEVVMRKREKYCDFCGILLSVETVDNEKIYCRCPLCGLPTIIPITEDEETLEVERINDFDI